MRENDANPTRDNFDRILSGLDGIPDATHAGPSTVRTVNFIGNSQTFIISTYRMREQGDTIFLESISSEGSMRIVLPPAVADAIARQRDSLTTKVRRKNGQRNAEERKRQGIAPGFMNHRPARTAQAKKRK